MNATDNLDLTGETALVTGAARGIGRAISRELVSRGADVLLVDLHAPTEAADELGREFPERQVLGGAADVRDPEMVRAAVERAADELGSLTILVNNAGTVSRSNLEDMTLEEWTLDIDTNLRGCFLMCQTALTSPRTRDHLRTVVNISSISGIMGGPRSGSGDGGGRSGAAYAASKGGVIALTKWLAKEVGDRAITVNSVAPGPVATAMTTSVPYVLDDQLIKRMGTPEEVAAAVAYLASPGARYVTGQVIRVCGGASLG